MDATIVAEAAQMSLVASPMVTVTTVIVVDDLALNELVSLFDHATIVAPFLAMGGTSVSAIAPTLFHEREVSGLSIVG